MLEDKKTEHDWAIQNSWTNCTERIRLEPKLYLHNPWKHFGTWAAKPWQNHGLSGGNTCSKGFKHINSMEWSMVCIRFVRLHGLICLRILTCLPSCFRFPWVHDDGMSLDEACQVQKRVQKCSSCVKIFQIKPQSQESTFPGPHRCQLGLVSRRGSDLEPRLLLNTESSNWVVLTRALSLERIRIY